MHLPPGRRRPKHAVTAVAALALIAGVQQAHADIGALMREALAYEHGEGVAKDQLKAAALYCNAARAGNAEAQYALGWMYTHGRGVPRDDGIAAGLFGLASEQGHLYAARALRFVLHAPRSLPDCMTPPVVAQPDRLLDLRELPAAKRHIVELVQRLAPDYNVHPSLALAIITVESNFNIKARSPKNAQGLMQLIPATAERFRVKDVLDPHDNIKGGLAYLRWLLSYYRGEVKLALAAYNAGEGAVDRHGGVPPYPETQNYVRRVQQLYGAVEHPYDARLARPSPVLATAATGRM